MLSADARPRLRLLIRRGVIGIVALGLAALAVVGGSVAFVRVSASGHLFSAADVPEAPVALVLGASVNPDGTPSPFLAARLDLAKALFEAGKVKVILVSGDNMAPEYNEPDAMRSYLINAGVPSAKVVADYAGFDTYDSCVRAKRIFNVTDLTIVTQGYHLPRAVATCRRLGVNANGVGDDTSRQYADAWRRGAIRDQVACVKTVIDLVTGRTPILGAKETSVDRALAG
ncbi:MAG: ElyC/SanA/YdcF family protein [Propionibacteriaceae bacterium]